MNKLTTAAAALVATAALIAAGCSANSGDDDGDCDSIGVVQHDRRDALAVELVAAHAGKGGGKKKSSSGSKGKAPARKAPKADLKKPGRTTPKATPTGKVRGSHGRSHVDLDDFDCEDDD
jgi:hypothetical protein